MNVTALAECIQIDCGYNVLAQKSEIDRLSWRPLSLFRAKGAMSSRPEESHPRALPGRVEDWRAGLGRSLCCLLSRPFVCECHTISTMPRFQPPPRRTQHADFLALRSPVCFASRLMGPFLPGRLSVLAVGQPGSC